MRAQGPEDTKRAEKESRPNEYEEMRDKGFSKEDRATIFYRPHLFFFKGVGRRELRNYLDSVQRLLPMPPKSTPITAALIDKTFRGKSGRVKHAERATESVLRAKANRSRKSKEHKRYLADIKVFGDMSKAEWREFQAEANKLYSQFGSGKVG